MAKLDLLTRLLEKVDKVLLFVKQQRRKTQLATLERELAPAIGEAFKAQGAVFANNLGKLRDKSPETWEAADWLPLLKDAQRDTAPLFLEPWKASVGEAIMQGAALTASEVGVKLVQEPAPAEIAITFGLKNPRAVEYLLREGAKLIAGVDDTTKEIIRGILARGASEGWSYDQVAKAIIEQFAEFAEGRPQEHIDSRAHGVAVTELGNAYSYGNWCTGQELKDQGLSVEKKSDTMGDERVCDICDTNQAAGWIAFDDEFPSTDLRPLFHPYCRCDMLIRVAPGRA